MSVMTTKKTSGGSGSRWHKPSKIKKRIRP